MANAKYIYCVILADKEMDFGAIGLDDERVYIIHLKGLACMVSDAGEDEYSLANEAHLKAHQLVLEKMMKQYETLPICFGTVAPGTKEVFQFLKQHHKEFKRLFKKMRGKVEIELEVFWKEMKGVFDEIVKKSKHLQTLKTNSKPKSREDLIMAGQFVAAQLCQKKAEEVTKYMKYLKGYISDYQINSTTRDELVLYGSFLVDKNKLDQFDKAVDRLEEENKERVKVCYIGPLPPYSFASVRM
ncbi:MAG: GvpL/GvpF family gas vesicle protein [Pseudomonadota bacterium]